MNFERRSTRNISGDDVSCYYVKFPGSRFKFLVGKALNDKNVAKAPSSITGCVRDGNYLMYCPEINAGIFDPLALSFCQKMCYTIAWVTEAELKTGSGSMGPTPECPQCKEFNEMMPKLKECITQYSKMQKTTADDGRRRSTRK